MLRNHRTMNTAAALLLALALSLGLLPGCMPAADEPQRTAEPAALSSAAETQASEKDRPTQIAARPLQKTTQLSGISQEAATVADIPAFDSEPGVYINGNLPSFTAADLAASFGTEEYQPLDQLGRCGAAFALVGPETEPTAKRGDISHIHPSGWQQAHYPDQGLDHLYERSHLLAHCLTAEDANERNLVTGTNFMNQGAMQTLEQKMDSYVDSTDHHIVLRVTPHFQGDELVARGVQMEGYSLEDEGEAICFNVYLYNVQPGIQIDYATGASQIAAALADTGAAEADEPAPAPEPEPTPAPEPAATPAAEPEPEPAPAPTPATCSYVLNTNSHKFHYPGCASVARMKEHNKSYVEATRDEVIARGYSPCGNCNP